MDLDLMGAGHRYGIVEHSLLADWKPWAGAYAGEKGKNFARKEDLNEILAEVWAVTATQREIEAKITGELWKRQMPLDAEERFVWSTREESEGFCEWVRSISGTDSMGAGKNLC